MPLEVYRQFPELEFLRCTLVELLSCEAENDPRPSAWCATHPTELAKNVSRDPTGLR